MPPRVPDNSPALASALLGVMLKWAVAATAVFAAWTYTQSQPVDPPSKEKETHQVKPKPKQKAKAHAKTSRPRPRPELDALLFDVFAYDESLVAESSEVPALVAAGRHIFEHHGLIAQFSIDTAKLDAFLQLAHEGMLHGNDYHNELHVTDVVQSVHAMIANTSLRELLTADDKLAVLVAAVIHDYGHRGLSNSFLQATNDPWQVEAGADRPANELHHAKYGGALLDRPECAMFPAGSDTAAMLARRVDELILATDMTQHKVILADLGSKCGTPEGMQRHRVLLMKGLLKVSDLGHAFAPVAVHQRWARQLEIEFWNEGDRRRELGLEIPMDLMDRTKNGVTHPVS